MNSPDAFDRRTLLRGIGLAATATPLAAAAAQGAVELPAWQLSREEFRAMGLPAFFNGVPSFLQVPIALTSADLKDADIAVLGIPWEGAMYVDNDATVLNNKRPPNPEAIKGRSGAYLAPDYLRQWSVMMSLKSTNGRMSEHGPNFLVTDYVKAVDCGNVTGTEGNVYAFMKDVTPRIREVVASGAMPIFLGGDHTLPAFTLPEIERAHEGKTGIIWIDQHYDLFWGKDLMPTAGSALCHFYQNARSSPENLAIIGIGGGQNTAEWEETSRQIGCTVFTIADVERLGMREVAARAMEVAGKGTDNTYVSFDVDSLDVMRFPAIKAACPYLLDPDDVRKALAQIVREQKVSGIDIVCFAPPYDVKGIAAMGAVGILFEAFVHTALKKRATAAKTDASGGAR
jgi:arginase